MKCADLTLILSELHNIGAATEKALVVTFVLMLGTKCRQELDGRSSLTFHYTRQTMCINVGHHQHTFDMFMIYN